MEGKGLLLNSAPPTMISEPRFGHSEMAYCQSTATLLFALYLWTKNENLVMVSGRAIDQN